MPNIFLAENDRERDEVSLKLFRASDSSASLPDRSPTTTSAMVMMKFKMIARFNFPDCVSPDGWL